MWRGRHANLDDIALAPRQCVELHIWMDRFQMWWTAFYRLLLTCLFDEIHASLCPPLHSKRLNVTWRAWSKHDGELMYICISTLFIVRQTQWRHTVLSERAAYWMEWCGSLCDAGLSHWPLVLDDGTKSRQRTEMLTNGRYGYISDILRVFYAYYPTHTWRNLNLTLAHDPRCWWFWILLCRR